jgi:hypothetical protein
VIERGLAAGSLGTDAARASVASWFGLAVHADAFRLSRRIFLEDQLVQDVSVLVDEDASAALHAAQRRDRLRREQPHRLELVQHVLFRAGQSQATAGHELVTDVEGRATSAK